MKRLLITTLTILIAFTLFGCAKEAAPPTTTTEAPTTETTTQPVNMNNPLTNETAFNPQAVGKRPVAIVVENLSPARPQWAIGTADIIVEGEVEGGISRMLWLYADYTAVPEKVGPVRSARPSYVKFSQFFDAIFIHWGGSHSKQNYTGGYETIKKKKVTHFDGMNGGELFGRDTSRKVSVEHRGILHGKKIPSAIQKKECRTKRKEARFSELHFNETPLPAGTTATNSLRCRFSKRTDTRKFTYKNGKYYTNDWKKEVGFTNIIILMDETKYITVPYKGASTTYLNYQYKGGSGYYASEGTLAEIQWKIADGKLLLQDMNGNPLAVNTGKSYIGLASSNNGGSVTAE